MLGKVRTGKGKVWPGQAKILDPGETSKTTETLLGPLKLSLPVNRL